MRFLEYSILECCLLQPTLGALAWYVIKAKETAAGEVTYPSHIFIFEREIYFCPQRNDLNFI